MSKEFRSSKPLAIEGTRNHLKWLLNRSDLTSHERAIIERAMHLMNEIVEKKHENPLGEALDVEFPVGPATVLSVPC